MKRMAIVALAVALLIGGCLRPGLKGDRLTRPPPPRPPHPPPRPSLSPLSRPPPPTDR